MFIGDAFAELDRRSTRRKLRHAAAQHESARQAALGALAESAAQAGVLVPAEQQALGQVAGQHGALAQHVAGLNGEIARLEAQRNAMIAGNAPQPAIADVDKTLYRLRGELAQKSSHASAAVAQRAAVLAQIGTAVYARGGSLGHVPQLGPAFANIAQIDHALAGTAQQLGASTAASAAAPKGAIAKLVGTAAVVGIGGAVAIGVATGGGGGGGSAGSNSSSSSSGSKTAPAGTSSRDLGFKPFSAEERVTGVGPEYTVKLWATEQAVRSEGLEDGKQVIRIVRRDLHKWWSLDPATKTYREQYIYTNDTPAPGPGQPTPNCKTGGGTQRIAGHYAFREVCDMFLGSGVAPAKETRWIAVDLAIMLKYEDGIETVEVTKLDVGDPDPALFELPTGYQKVDR